MHNFTTQQISPKGEIFHLDVFIDDTVITCAAARPAGDTQLHQDLQHNQIYTKCQGEQIVCLGLEGTAHPSGKIRAFNAVSVHIRQIFRKCSDTGYIYNL